MDGSLNIPEDSRRACWTPLGRALLDYHHGDEAAHFVVHSDLWEDEITAAEEYYRPQRQSLPEVELRALALCRGRVLDLGAGAGRHALELQERGHEVVAVDLSPDAAEVMRLRGVRDVRCGDLGTVAGERFDTILLLMHGIGLVGTVDRLADFLREAAGFLAEDGQILCDSADLERSVPAVKKDRRKRRSDPALHAWEVRFQLSYGALAGPPYRWLFISPRALQQIAGGAGYEFELCARGGRGAFLARLTPRECYPGSSERHDP